MNIFNTYTLRTLKKNKTRTIVTIIGIILSVAMFTAVTEALVSGSNFLINVTKATIGSFNAQYVDITKNQLDKLKSDKNYKAVAYSQEIGYAKVDSKNVDKPYIYIAGISNNYTDLVSVRLTEGRMAEKANEIVISKHLSTNGRLPVKIGDTLMLNVGTRESEGYRINKDSYYDENEESLEDVKVRTYKVVGICERPDTSVEAYSQPGYTAYTLPENNNSLVYTAFFTLQNPSDVFELACNDNEYGLATNLNNDLLMFSGNDINNEFFALVSGLAVILIVIIILGSISLIYNSFSISVGERTKQFGVLRSIGATKKQTVKSVLFEALALSVIAIPLGSLSGCIGLAITFKALSSQFTKIIGNFVVCNNNITNPNTTISLVINPIAILSAAVIGFITVIISAYIPAKRAMKMPAIEAIRMSKDIKNGKVKEKTGKITYKLFGFGGMVARKNFARNKKRYTSTVISLAMSLILFISASSLSYYAKKSINASTDIPMYDIIATLDNGLGEMSNEKVKSIIYRATSLDNISDYAVASRNYADNKLIDATQEYISEDFKKYRGDIGIDSNKYDSTVKTIYLNDEAFNKLCKDNSINSSSYYNKENPKALLYDFHQREVLADDNLKHTVYTVFKNDLKNTTLTMYDFKTEYKGYYYCEDDEKGNFVYRKLDKETDSFDENAEPLIVSSEEVINSYSINVGDRINNQPFYLGKDDTMLIYPESIASALTNSSVNEDYSIAFISTDHSKLYEDLMKINQEENNELFVRDITEDNESESAFITLLTVFSYGFITLISLIAAANVFNTISTNIMLRRRELAMLKSAGMSMKAIMRMMNYESLLYGLKSIIIGLPIALVSTISIYLFVFSNGFNLGFSLPLGNIVFALISVFIVVFASMVYSVNKIKKYNTADELKIENI